MLAQLLISHAEILIQRVKKLAPEEIARKIQQFDQEMCTQLFLSELKPVLPSPEQVGKLNVYRNAEPEELAGLHLADRLMVKLIQIDRLGPRIEGMLYKCTFDESWGLLHDVRPTRFDPETWLRLYYRALENCTKLERLCSMPRPSKSCSA